MSLKIIIIQVGAIEIGQTGPALFLPMLLLLVHFSPFWTILQISPFFPAGIFSPFPCAVDTLTNTDELYFLGLSP